MRFIVSSSELLMHLQMVSKVIGNRNSLPILDNFLFNLRKDEVLTVTTSDLETTLTTEIEDLSMVEGEGNIAIESKRLLEILRLLPEQPLTFEINEENLDAIIFSENGEFSIAAYPPEDFPLPPEVDKEKGVDLVLDANLFLNGINTTLFATGDDELRPVMNGIFIEFLKSFILPNKPSSLLKSFLSKEDNVSLKFDDKNAIFSIGNRKLVCRLQEGEYPAYNNVIPLENPNKMVIERMDFLNSLKRVHAFSNEITSLVELELDKDQIKVSAKDVDYNVSAYENLSCEYSNEKIKIGFKGSYLTEILQNLKSADINFELSDPNRAALLFPYVNENENEDVLMLIMPMMIDVYYAYDDRCLKNIKF
ncbi:MAG: hypothetical protein B6I24_00215 [Bacteroidetes bacterium 4572_128]|nr:MAG: hypothetical protein B6I24_00215 [Bacteroidetes bacterium 4572_128]